jgi:hypothetical protein
VRRRDGDGQPFAVTGPDEHIVTHTHALTIANADADRKRRTKSDANSDTNTNGISDCNRHWKPASDSHANAGHNTIAGADVGQRDSCVHHDADEFTN